MTEGPCDTPRTPNGGSVRVIRPRAPGFSFSPVAGGDNSRFRGDLGLPMFAVWWESRSGALRNREIRSRAPLSFFRALRSAPPQLIRLQPDPAGGGRIPPWRHRTRPHTAFSVSSRLGRAKALLGRHMCVPMLGMWWEVGAAARKPDRLRGAWPPFRIRDGSRAVGRSVESQAIGGPASRVSKMPWSDTTASPSLARDCRHCSETARGRQSGTAERGAFVDRNGTVAAQP
jgi:hypothetical protein